MEYSLAFSLDPKSEIRSVGGVRARRTIGVLISYMELFGVVGYEGQVRTALDRVCRERDLSLLFVYGRALGDKEAISTGHNAIYRLMHGDSVDGLLVLSAMLGSYTGTEEVARLCQGFGSLPLVSLGAVLPGIPSVVVDNRSGMEAVVEHLVRDHGRRHLAFINGPPGNPDAQTRFEAYQSVLRRYGLPIDPQRVASGQFVRSKGQTAADEILDRGLELDAIVAANDGMALGVLEALRKRGIGVPHELAVTGFDNLDLARLGFPPLTTVAQPLERMVNLGVRLLVDQLDGRTVPLLTELPAELVARQSCGCGRSAGSSRPHPDTSLDRLALLQQSTPQILGELAAGKLMVRVGVSADAAQLLSALELELQGHKDSFLPAVHGIVTGNRTRQRALPGSSALAHSLARKASGHLHSRARGPVGRSTRHRCPGQHRQSSAATCARR